MKKIKVTFAIFSLLSISACVRDLNSNDETTYTSEPRIIESDTSFSENVYRIDTPYGYNPLGTENFAPEVYTIVATRAVNKMLDDTRSIYEKNGKAKIYVTETEIEDQLPNGKFLSERVTEQIIDASRTFVVVNNKNDADYYTETLIKKIEIEGNNSPMIQYKITLFEKDGKKVNEWTEVIRQVQNDDKSWW